MAETWVLMFKWAAASGFTGAMALFIIAWYTGKLCHRREVDAAYQSGNRLADELRKQRDDYKYQRDQLWIKTLEALQLARSATSVAERLKDAALSNTVVPDSPSPDPTPDEALSGG